MKLHGGWEIVCPDGHVRLYPYHNEHDAICDAAVLTAAAEVARDRGLIGQRLCVPDPVGDHPPCPGGEHVHRAIQMACPEHGGAGPGEA
jgi:hypothetical protein